MTKSNLVFSWSPDIQKIFEEKIDNIPEITYYKNMKITFQIAVLLAVGEIRKNDNIFSIHDITKFVREKVNNGTYNITDTDFPIISTNKYGEIRDIPHQSVKTIFLDLINVGAITNLVETLNPLGYRQYSNKIDKTYKLKDSHTPLLATIGSPNDETTVSDWRGPSGAQVIFYIEDNWDEDLGYPTVKMVQSRFKNFPGITCLEYADFIDNLDFGLKVNRMPLNTPSFWNIS